MRLTIFVLSFAVHYCLAKFQAFPCGTMPFVPSHKPELVFDGHHTIYVVGLYTFDRGSKIYKANITTQYAEFEEIGTFPDKVVGGATAVDKNGDILYFGGESVYVAVNRIYKIKRESPAPVLVEAELNVGRRGHSAVTIGDSVFIIGGDMCGSDVCNVTTIEEFDLNSNTIKIVAKITSPQYLAYTSAITDGTFAYIFGGFVRGRYFETTYDTVLRFNPRTREVKLLNKRLPESTGRSSAVLLNNVAYIFPTSDTTCPDDDVFLFDTRREKAIFDKSGVKTGSGIHAAVYAKRSGWAYDDWIYVFGSPSTGYHDDSGIMCMMIPAEPIFDCSGLSDGSYPHPSDCAKFVMCSGGINYEMDCPANLHFDQDKLTCMVPEEANCSV